MTSTQCANSNQMQTLGKYSMNLLAGRDVKKTLVIVIKGLTEDFIIGMNLIG